VGFLGGYEIVTRKTKKKTETVRRDLRMGLKEVRKR